MHSPWRVPPGRTWAEYRLALPHETPVTLSFGSAMDPASVMPGKSDGVPFSRLLLDGGNQRELLRRHRDKGRWEDHSFDLSTHAGETITLRLQVEPGPKNNSSWDFSYFGDGQQARGDDFRSVHDRAILHRDGQSGITRHGRWSCHGYY